MNSSRAPDFLIIGAQKCGTSWLHHHLRQSESIFMPADKDFEHFTYVGNLTRPAFNNYCRRFDSAPAEQIIGDANAGYFWTRTNSKWNRQPDSFNPDIPGSIRAFCGPDLKIILMLRDPVERAISAYLHHLRHGAITTKTSILDTGAPLGIIDMGFYDQHLDHWQSVYPAENFHIIRKMPSTASLAIEIMQETCRFLSARDITQDQYYLEPIFPGLERIIDEEGVWVSGETLRSFDSQRTPAEPEALVDGRALYRVVNRAEIEELKMIFGRQSMP